VETPRAFPSSVETTARIFDWQTVTIDGYPQVAQDGSRNIADVTDTFGNLDVFRRHGGKLLTFVGGNDQLIMPRSVINYYRQMASRFGQGAGKGPDFDRLQEFYRLFRAPGVAHCGGGSGPQPQNLFDALVKWVEHGAAPAKILAQTTSGGVTRTRPLCPIRRPPSTTAAVALTTQPISIAAATWRCPRSSALTCWRNTSTSSRDRSTLPARV
jgi:hypothetical protein